MTTLEQIYNAGDANWIRDWLDYGKLEYSRNDLLNRLQVTILINNAGDLAPSDQKYVADPDFNDLYLAKKDPDAIRQIIDQKSVPKDCQNILTLHGDIAGSRIFDIFVKKDRANNIYGKERDRVRFFYDTKQLTPQDRDTLLGIVDNFEQVYNLFITRVDKDRIFYEKASSGAPPRKIVTPEDWAEAIIELQDTTTKFKQVMENNLQMYVSPDRLQEYCEATPYAQCSYPCTKQSSRFFRDGSCLYKR